MSVRLRLLPLLEPGNVELFRVDGELSLAEAVLVLLSGSRLPLRLRRSCPKLLRRRGELGRELLARTRELPLLEGLWLR